MTPIFSKLYFGCDHAGFELKQQLLQMAIAGVCYEDCGTDSVLSCDYPDIAQRVCAALQEPQHAGILICGTGIGMSIAANRFSHVRAALCNTVEGVTLSRGHNNANILCLGARFLEAEQAIPIVQAFLTTPFEGGRHQRRLEKII